MVRVRPFLSLLVRLKLSSTRLLLLILLYIEESCTTVVL